MSRSAFVVLFCTAFFLALLFAALNMWVLAALFAFIKGLFLPGVIKIVAGRA